MSRAALYHGIANVDKPHGLTSHDVVARVRRILGQRSVGHTGTLDPMATGVLLVCVGQATRVAEYLAGGDKEYEALVRLGLTTDSYDVEGEVLTTALVPDMYTADVERVLAPFVGEIQQLPPAYSAIKQDGVPLYRKARRGEAIELRPRPVRIDEIEVLAWQSPDLRLRVKCGPGTYIRSLAHDLGQQLGCGATLAGLVRTRSGMFRLEDATSLEQLAAAATAGDAARYLRPMADALGTLMRIVVDEQAATRLSSGQPIRAVEESLPGASAYAQTPDGSVIAILAHDTERALWWPKKVFVS